MSSSVDKSEYLGDHHLRAGLGIVHRIDKDEPGSWRKALRQFGRSAAHYDRAAALAPNDDAASKAKHVRDYANRFKVKYVPA